MPQAERDETVAGVGDQGHARIADQRNLRALLQRDDEFRRACQFVVFVVAHQRFVNVVMGEELLRMAGVFTGDLVGLFQDAQRAQRNVLEIADRRSDQIEDAGTRRRGPSDRAGRCGLRVAVATGGNRGTICPGFYAWHGTSLARCCPCAPLSRAKRMVYFRF